MNKEIITVPELIRDFKLAANDRSKLSHSLWQTRQWDTQSNPDFPFFDYVKRINAKSGKVYFNIDGSAQNGFDETASDKNRVNFLNKSCLPSLIGQYLGRNHIRIFMIGETVYFSNLDFSAYTFERKDLIFRITDPELVQYMKTLAFTDKSFSAKVNDTTLHRANGRDESPIRAAAKRKIKEFTAAGKPVEIYFVSSWIPDSLTDDILHLIKRNDRAAVSMIIRSPMEFESISKLPFTATKLLSYLELQIKTLYAKLSSQERRRLRIIQSSTSFHGKFIAAASEGNYWWLAGTDNFTNFGYLANTTEADIEGKDEQIAHELFGYIERLNTEK